MVAYVRTVKTASGATAVQIVWSSRRGSRTIEHLGSAHDEAAVGGTQGRGGSAAGRGSGRARPGAGPARARPARRWRSSSSRSAHLWEALCSAYQVLGFDAAAGGDEVFRDLVLARIIEPTSKVDCAAGA